MDALHEVEEVRGCGKSTSEPCKDALHQVDEVTDTASASAEPLDNPSSGAEDPPRNAGAGSPPSGVDDPIQAHPASPSPECPAKLESASPDESSELNSKSVDDVAAVGDENPESVRPPLEASEAPAPAIIPIGQHVQPNIMHQPFNSDICVEREVGRILGFFNVTRVVETGTFRGATTECFMKMPTVQEVFTVEADPANHAFTQHRLAALKRVHCLLGDSAQVLMGPLMDHLVHMGTVLFYLDAHWYDHWPLQDEIRAIARRMPDRAIIVIDDFKVPNRPFQYDSYKEQANDFQSVKAALDAAYPGGYFHYYNRFSLAAVPTGKLYVLPKVLLDFHRIDPSIFIAMEDGEPYAKGDEVFM